MNGIPKIIEVKPLDDMVLLVSFENGTRKKYDVKQLFDKFEIFKQLKNRVLFDQVHVDCGGYGISWNDDIDMSEYEIWYNGIPA